MFSPRGIPPESNRRLLFKYDIKNVFNYKITTVHTLSHLDVLLPIWILDTGLELACNGAYARYNIIKKRLFICIWKDSRISLSSKLVPVQNREYE